LQIETRASCFAQIWIFDTAEERVSLRQRAFKNLDVGIVRLIENTLALINPFVQSLYINGTRLRAEPNIGLELRIVERKETTVLPPSGRAGTSLSLGCRKDA
jgi:hypothetical protein